MAEVRKILIVSNFFYPEITPRAFRTTELAREFGRRGDEVTLVIPNKEAYRDQPLDLQGVTIKYADSPLSKEGAVTKARSARKLMPTWMLRILLYFYNHEYFAKYDKGITRRLMELEGEYDLLISISYPVAIHRSVLYALKHNQKLKSNVKFAEFSDPPMRGEYNRHFFPAYHNLLYKMGRKFDRFVIPVSNAMPCYTRYKTEDQIIVIPQGFDFSDIKTPVYTPNTIPTFAYAGRFYRLTRDPEFFFEYLATLDFEFRFVIFMLNPEPYFMEMIERYRGRIKGVIEVENALPRSELIERLSKMDFILNFEFTYSTATPSKLIDYSLAGREVISFSSLTFDRNKFDQFMAGDYSSATPLPDISAYDIRNVAASFLKFSEELAT